MWERREKTQVGTVSRIYKDRGETVFDSLDPDNSNNCNNANLKVEYTVESLRKENYEAWERAQRVDNDLEPWEMFDEFHTDSLGAAIGEVVIRTFDPNCPLDPNMWMNIKDSQGNESEVHAELPSTLRHTIHRLVEKDLRERVDHMEKENEFLRKGMETFEEFVKVIPDGERLFREFCDMKKIYYVNGEGVML